MTEIQTTSYVSKPSMVDAIQITPENMQDIAKWCGGTIEEKEFKTRGGQVNVVRYIKVRVTRAMNRRQTEGIVGDYILLRGGDFKVYTEKAFNASYTDDLSSIPLTVLKEEDTGDLIYQSMVERLLEVKEKAKKPVEIRMGPHTATIPVSSPTEVPFSEA